MVKNPPQIGRFRPFSRVEGHSLQLSSGQDPGFLLYIVGMSTKRQVNVAHLDISCTLEVKDHYKNSPLELLIVNRGPP